MVGEIKLLNLYVVIGCWISSTALKSGRCFKLSQSVYEKMALTLSGLRRLSLSLWMKA